MGICSRYQLKFEGRLNHFLVVPKESLDADEFSGVYQL